MTLVAITAVASFESVGNILVVAMLVVPPAAASLCTERLSRMIWLSLVFAVASAVLGHWSALTVPRWFGFKSTTDAGMMATMAGCLFVAALIFAPRNGLLAKLVRHYRLTWSIFGDDLLAYLYRKEERSLTSITTPREIQQALFAKRWTTHLMIAWYTIIGNLQKSGDNILLTEDGRRRALELVRSHRLWEQYLVEQAGVSTNRIHQHAERLEHYTSRLVRDALERETEFPDADPHGSPIPRNDLNCPTSSSIAKAILVSRGSLPSGRVDRPGLGARIRRDRADRSQFTGGNCPRLYRCQGTVAAIHRWLRAALHRRASGRGMAFGPSRLRTTLPFDYFGSLTASQRRVRTPLGRPARTCRWHVSGRPFRQPSPERPALEPALPVGSQLRPVTTTIIEEDQWLEWLSRFRNLFGDRGYLLGSLHRGVDDRAKLEHAAFLAEQSGVPLLASGDVHYHLPERQAVHDLVLAIASGKNDF